MKHYRVLWQAFKAVDDFGPDDAVVVDNFWLIIDARTEAQATEVAACFTPTFKNPDITFVQRPDKILELDERQLAEFLANVQASDGTVFRVAVLRPE
ncbi:MAG: hypothetical protein C0404_05530 [Verrucomicrobia bacterium]|nr:hypothetical protein [Verrucomicrobiota bacterium]